MITFEELLEKTINVVHAEITSSGGFTSHFCAMDLCGRLTVITLSNCCHPDALGFALHIMSAYSRHFQPASIVLVFGRPRFDPVTNAVDSIMPTVTGFSFDNDICSVTGYEAGDSKAPDIQAYPFNDLSPYLHLFKEPRPKNAAERAEAEIEWALIHRILSPIHTHSSVGNN